MSERREGNIELIVTDPSTGDETVVKIGHGYNNDVRIWVSDTEYLDIRTTDDGISVSCQHDNHEWRWLTVIPQGENEILVRVAVRRRP